MQQNSDKKYLFEVMPIPRAYLKLSIPVVLSSLVTMLYNLADTFFVGMLNDPVQNAAVTLVFPVTLAFNAVNNLFGVGGSSMMSRSLGAGNEEKVRITSAFSFYGTLCSGILFSLLCLVFRTPLLGLLGADKETFRATSQYLFWTVCMGAAPTILNVVQSYMVRSEGAALHASIGTMSGCLINILLDPVFILPWGLNMGAAGAGLATFVSNVLACSYFIILALCKGSRTYVCMNVRKLRKLSRDVVAGVTTVGFPALIQNLVNVLGATILNNFTAAFGAPAVAAMGISQKLHAFVVQIMMGAGQGIMPLVSYNYTGGNRKRMKKSILFALSLIVPIGAGLTVFYWVQAPGLIHLFIDNREIVEIGTRLLRAMCLSMMCLSVDFTTVGVFQALGLGRYAFCYAMIRKILMEIPLLFLLNSINPLYGLPYAQVLSELTLAISSVFMLRRIFRNSPDLHQS